MSTERTKRRTAIAVGTFDGVHRGHQAILAAVDRAAREKRLERLAYAFRFPPRLVLSGKGPGLILPEPRKVELLGGFVDRVVSVDFREVGALPAQRFVIEQLVDGLRAQAIVVGEGFRFGHGRRGDESLLRRIGARSGVRIEIVPPFEVDGAVVSSTRIRHLITAGHVRAASALLGRDPELAGRVVHGDRLGRRLGYPTANLSIDPVVLIPAAGVYAARAHAHDAASGALLYIGTRPTLAGTVPQKPRCEVHLLDPPADDLYGESLRVELVERLRPDRSFPSLDALRRQMERDIAAARDLLTPRSGGEAPSSVP
jgi:riboflavin kinase / FMN adenylyltransferase